MTKATRCRLWALLTLLLVFAWSTSTFYLVEVKTPWGFAVGLTRGRAYVHEDTSMSAWEYQARPARTGRNAGVFRHNGHFEWAKMLEMWYGRLITFIPLWPFFLVTGAACALLYERKPADNACPHCRYPRGSSPVCTECGKTLP